MQIEIENDGIIVEKNEIDVKIDGLDKIKEKKFTPVCYYYGGYGEYGRYNYEEDEYYSRGKEKEEKDKENKSNAEEISDVDENNLLTPSEKKEFEYSLKCLYKALEFAKDRDDEYTIYSLQKEIEEIKSILSGNIDCSDISYID